MSRISKIVSEVDIKYWEKEIKNKFDKMSSILEELDDAINEMSREYGQEDFRSDNIRAGIINVEKKVKDLKTSFDRYLKYNK